jgi:hypothetical protein
MDATFSIIIHKEKGVREAKECKRLPQVSLLKISLTQRFL